MFGMTRLEKYVRLLGKDQQEVKELLELAELRPDMRRNIEARLLQILKQTGDNIVDLPPFTLAAPSREYGAAFSIGTGFCGGGVVYDYLIDLDSFVQSGLIVGTPRVGKSKLAQVVALGVVSS